MCAQSYGYCVNWSRNGRLRDLQWVGFSFAFRCKPR